jgi:hemerythrin-like domain-containing protein
MDKYPKPIKRSKELVPLSKEHHEGLLFGWKIKQGLRNGTPHTTISAFIEWFWEADLQEHFRKEEEVLAVHLPPDNELVLQMLDEHENLEAQVRLCTIIQDEELFLQLADGLHNHIRFEERVLFPFAEQNIPPENMKIIYEQLLTQRPHRKWEDEFWVRKT